MSDPLNIDAIYDQIKAVLESHRMSFTYEDEDSTLPLVDMLCAPGAKDVETGKEEIIAICDAIYSEVLQPLATLSHPATQAGALQAVGRKPLTDTQIAALRSCVPDGDFMGEEEQAAFTRGIEAAERHHGIGTAEQAGAATRLPAYGALPWETVRAYVEAATGSAPIIDPTYSIGHQVVGINYNSLNRIMSALAATQPNAAPGDGHVWLKCDGCGKDMRSHDRMGHCAAPTASVLPISAQHEATQAPWVSHIVSIRLADGSKVVTTEKGRTQAEANERALQHREGARIDGEALVPIGYTSSGAVKRLLEREDDSLTVDAESCIGCDVPVYLAAPSTATAAREQELTLGNVNIKPSNLPGTTDATITGEDCSMERELDLYDEIECDLPSLFGRAAAEGHEAAQRLAKQVQEKMRRARNGEES